MRMIRNVAFLLLAVGALLTAPLHARPECNPSGGWVSCSFPSTWDMWCFAGDPDGPEMYCNNACREYYDTNTNGWICYSNPPQGEPADNRMYYVTCLCES